MRRKGRISGGYCEQLSGSCEKCLQSDCMSKSHLLCDPRIIGS